MGGKCSEMMILMEGKCERTLSINGENGMMLIEGIGRTTSIWIPRTIENESS